MQKIVKIFVILLICLSVFCGQIYANYTDPITNPGAYEPNANPESSNTELIERGSLVLGIIRTLGSFAAVIILMVLGLKYMIGSIEQKADFKQMMGPYLIGAIMVFAIPNIIAIAYDLITTNIK